MRIESDCDGEMRLQGSKPAKDWKISAEEEQGKEAGLRLITHKGSRDRQGEKPRGRRWDMYRLKLVRELNVIGGTAEC